MYTRRFSKYSERARNHVVKFSRALILARALCEGACYRDYIFRVRSERHNCLGFVFYDVRETLYLAATAKRLSSVAVAALPPRTVSFTAVVEKFSVRGEDVKIYATPKWKRALPLKYSSPRNIRYFCLGEANIVDIPRNVYLGCG